MRVAFIKQSIDVFGPWASIRWCDIVSPQDLFTIWPSKTSFWEMTCLLKADWYIVPEVITSDYHNDLIARNPEFKDIASRYVKNTVRLENIPFQEYDIIITLDPILTKLKSNSSAVFAYLLNEHFDRLYARSLIQPMGNYDVFLAHMMDSQADLIHLRQAVSFPYMYSQDMAESVFVSEKEDSAWIDWRTLITLSATECWRQETDRAALRLQEVLNIPIRYYGDFNHSYYGVADPPAWGNGAIYLKRMGRCKYYISVAGCYGAGQALCDAASLGCICIGSKGRPYHQMVCHPECLCPDMIDMPKMLNKIISSFSLQKEILIWQKEALRKYFLDKPLDILKKAISLKRSESCQAIPAGGSGF